MDTSSLAKKQKDQRIDDKTAEQRSNNLAEQHHLTNGHESLNMLKVSSKFLSFS